MGFIYTPGAMQALALHYHDTHEDVLAMDAYADFDTALAWLGARAPELRELIDLWMLGHMEVDLAYRYTLKPRTLARLLDQVFLVLAQYLNDERPIELPNMDALRAAEPPTLIELVTESAYDLVIALVDLSMSFSFLPKS